VIQLKPEGYDLIDSPIEHKYIYHI